MRDHGQGELYRRIAIGNYGRISSPAKIQAVVDQPRLGRMVREVCWGFSARPPLSEKYEWEHEMDYGEDRDRWGSLSRVCCRLERFEVRGLRAADTVWTVGAFSWSPSSRTVERITIGDTQTPLTPGQHCALVDSLSFFSPLHVLILDALPLASSVASTTEPATREFQTELRLRVDFNATSEAPLPTISHSPQAIPPLLAAIVPEHLETASVSCDLGSVVHLDWLKTASFPALTGLDLWTGSDSPHLLLPRLTPVLSTLGSLRSLHLYTQSLLDRVLCTAERDVAALGTFLSALPSSLRQLHLRFLIDPESLDFLVFLRHLELPDHLASILLQQLGDNTYLSVKRMSPQSAWVIEQ